MDKDDICQDCKKWQESYKDKVLINQACYEYNRAFHDLMVNYKRYGDYVLRKVLAELVYDKVPQADYYVPIPTSLDHRKKRKYDTIYEIFNSLVPLTPLLTKLNTEEAQGEKSKKERMMANQSFEAIEGVKIEGQVVLLDDIYTTGRTLYHARDALIKKYPNLEIKSFTIAR
nr:ComF family protein [Lactobacillus sp. PV012]